MKIDELNWNRGKGWFFQRKRVMQKEKVQIVFIFGIVSSLLEHDYFCSLRNIYPNAYIVGGSSAGNIQDTYIATDDIVATAIQFEKSEVKIAIKKIKGKNSSFDIGQSILQELKSDDLKHILLFSDGTKINGSMLVNGINSNNENVTVSGGLLGEDTATFKDTYVVANKEAQSNYVVAVGLYGKDLIVNSGSSSGWEDFGAERVITKSTGDTVYEIDGQPALDLYKKYLGELAKELPASGLRFPLNIWKENSDIHVIRTLSSINEKNKTLTFVGDVPQNYKARLMKTNIDGLIDGAEEAVKMTNFRENKNSNSNALCIAISCIGRRLVLNQLTEEELEVLRDYFGNNVSIVGFYSYGEIAPFSKGLQSCHFHNQTMTVTVIEERV